MSRNPKENPQFGDVFRYTLNSVSARMEVMFIQGDTENWVALDLPDGGMTDGYIGVSDPGWEFVEHLDGHASGGTYRKVSLAGMQKLARAAGLTHRELLDLPAEEFNRLVGADL